MTSLMCCLWFGSHSSFYMGIPSLPQNNFLSKIEVIDSSLPCTTTWEKPLSASSGNHRAPTVMSDVTCPLPKPAIAAKGKDSLYTLKSCWSWGVDGLFHRDGRGSGWVELCVPQYRALFVLRINHLSGSSFQKKTLPPKLSRLVICPGQGPGCLPCIH